MALKFENFRGRHPLKGEHNPPQNLNILSVFLSSSLLFSFFLGFLFIYSYESELKAQIYCSPNGERAVKVMAHPVKFEGVSEELQKILDADMDHVGPRRRAREAFKDIQLSIDHILFKVFGNCYFYFFFFQFNNCQLWFLMQYLSR